MDEWIKDFLQSNSNATAWKEAVKVWASVGSATFAMLVPSEDSSMESERLTISHRMEDTFFLFS